MEARVKALERQMGLLELDHVSSVTPNNDDTNWESRLETLERRLLSEMPESLRETTTTIHRLMQDLDPGTALTHQQQIVAPILYRRQEILACQEPLSEQIKLVSQILQLLIISQPPLQENKKITEEQVIQAPILMSNLMVPDSEVNRLDALAETLLDLQRRMDIATRRLDQVLDHYHSLVSSVSEKLVLAQETVTSLTPTTS